MSYQSNSRYHARHGYYSPFYFNVFCDPLKSRERMPCAALCGLCRNGSRLPNDHHLHVWLGCQSVEGRLTSRSWRSPEPDGPESVGSIFERWSRRRLAGQEGMREEFRVVSVRMLLLEDGSAAILRGDSSILCRPSRMFGDHECPMLRIPQNVQ